jgi:hypothetical protein
MKKDLFAGRLIVVESASEISPPVSDKIDPNVAPAAEAVKFIFEAIIEISQIFKFKYGIGKKLIFNP